MPDRTGPLIHARCLTAAVPALAMLLAGCEALGPKNTLVFGTTTAVALDVSFQPQAAFAVTLGYKRNEGVYMPLTPHRARDHACSSANCANLTGKAGANAGVIGDDAYSVLATFDGGFEAGSGPLQPPPADQQGEDRAAAAPQANGRTRQIFATGNAARLLAATSGAQLVNPAAAPPDRAALAVAVSEEASARAEQRKTQVAQVLARVAPNGVLDEAAYAALVDRAALSTSDRERLRATTDAATLRAVLELQFDGRIAHALAAALE